jgi:hypothetical protein
VDIYVDDIHLLGKNINFIKNNAEILLQASKAIGLEGSVNKYKRI